MKLQEKIFVILAILLFSTLFILGFNRNVNLNKFDNEDYRCLDCNVILISIDTLRADHLGSYGYGRNTSPNIDRFADESIIFENTYSTAPVTAPSHMSIMTSLYPSEHRVCNWERKEPWCKHSLEGRVITLAQILKARNYSTMAYTGGGNVHGDLGFKNGFDVYHNDKDFVDYNDTFEWLDDFSKDNKFFLFLHTYKIHDPYFPADETRTKICGEYEGTVISSKQMLNKRIGLELQNQPDSELSKGLFVSLKDNLNKTKNAEVRRLVNKGFSRQNVIKIGQEFEKDPSMPVPDKILRQFTFPKEGFNEKDLEYLVCLYDSEIFEMDTVMNRLFLALDNNDLSDNTIVIFTSDHGEEFKEHGGFLHFHLYNEIIQVPLIIKNPRLNYRKHRVRTRVSGIDILPTVLDMLGIDLKLKIRGKSLVPTITGDTSESLVFSELYSLRRRSIIDGDYKLISYPRYTELFNIDKDYSEQKNLVNSKHEIADRLISKLREHIPMNTEPSREDEFNADEETLEQLRELGYLA